MDTEKAFLTKRVLKLKLELFWGFNKSPTHPKKGIFKVYVIQKHDKLKI